MTTPGNGALQRRARVRVQAPGSGAKTSPWTSAPYRLVNETGVICPRVPSQSAR